MSEDALWLNVRDKLQPFGHLVRIENRCDLGTPDFFYTLRVRRLSRSGWCELKHKPSWPVRDSEPLVLPKLTLEQVTWIEQEDDAGGRVCMLAQFGSGYLIADAAQVRLIYERELTRQYYLDKCPQRLTAQLDRKWLLEWLTQ